MIRVFLSAASAYHVYCDDGVAVSVVTGLNGCSRLVLIGCLMDC